MSLQAFDERIVLLYSRLFLPADGTALVTVAAANSGDRRLDACMVANRDTIPHVVNLQMTNGAILTQLGSLSVPAGQGYAGTPALDLFASVLPVGQVGLVLSPATTLQVSMSVAIVATFDVSVTMVGGSF